MAADERRDDDPTTDAGLLERARDLRDESAWRELVRRYEAAVRRYCRSASLGVADVEGLAQDVWLKLIEKLPRWPYDPSRSFRGWLRTMCRHAVVDDFRKLGRSLTTEPLGDREPIAPREVTTTIGARRRPSSEEAARIEAAVRGQVKADSWEIFRRCAINGERLSDVARDLGKQYGAAYMACERVRTRLRQEGDRRAGGGTDR